MKSYKEWLTEESLSDIPKNDWAGRIVYHGTDRKSYEDILKRGIDMEKSSKGYFGKGFYTTPDEALAKSNYADFTGEDEDDTVVIKLRVNPKARILDLRSEEGWDKYSKLGLGKDLNRDDLDKLMVRNGVDGLVDNSFEGLVMYNPKMISVVKD